MRQSTDQTDASGNVLNGFDYGLQVWVTAGVILRCGHPGERCSCNARRFAGMTVLQARETEAARVASLGRVPTTCIEHGPGGTLRLSHQIKVF
jgi:hypothetical protein